MAVDKLVDSTQLDADLTSVSNAIRTKGGISSQLVFPNGFVSAVQAIPTGSGKTLLADYTASEDVSEIVMSGNFSGYTFYYLEVNGSCSRTEWIYPTFNDVQNTSSYWGGQSGATFYNMQVPIGTQVTGNPLVPNSVNKLLLFATAIGTYSYAPEIGSTFSKLSLKLYNAASLFLSGFNVKLWGLSV